MKQAFIITILLYLACIASSCSTVNSFGADSTVKLPFIKNSANECYYLDEFMPVPDSLVSGESGKLRLRYYTYTKANYKDLEDKHIILSFYSDDERCWSLFEEFYVSK